LNTRDQHSDKFLLEALMSGSEEAFDLLFKKYSGRLYYVAYQYLNDREETLEIIQEVFYRVWINHSKIKPDLPFVPYLSRIAKNLIINQSKRKLIENAYLQSLGNGSAYFGKDTEDQVQFLEIRQLVNDLVDKFPKKRKEVFLLSRNKGLSNKEISEKLSISESTVENHINKALNLLRSDLKNAGYLGSLFIIFQNISF
jgi:RNA polymerase sigma-70 factor (family 1)